jgi:hypothetical protein
MYVTVPWLCWMSSWPFHNVLRVYVTVPWVYSTSSWPHHNVCACPQGVCDCSIVHAQCQADHVLRMYVILPCAYSVSSWQSHNLCASPQMVCDCSMCIPNVKLTISQCLCMSSGCVWLFCVHPHCQADHFTMSMHVLRWYVMFAYAGLVSTDFIISLHVLRMYVTSMCVLNVKLTMSQCLSISAECMWIFHVHGGCQAYTFTISVHVLRTQMCVAVIYIINVKLTIWQSPCMPSDCMWLFHVHTQCQADNLTMSVHVHRVYVTICAYSMSSLQSHNAWPHQMVCNFPCWCLVSSRQFHHVHACP